MENIEIIDEIIRIFEIMNNKKGLLLIESMLLFEQDKEILKSIKRGISNYFDDAGERAIERFLVQDSRPFEQRLETWLDGLLNKGAFTKADKLLIGDFFVASAKSSEKFRKKFVEAQLEKWKRIENKKGTAWFEGVIKSTFGDDVLNEYKVLKSASPKPVVNPINPINPINPNNKIPTLLGDTEGVKKFQQWLNDTYPTWNSGKKLSTKGKSFGTYGPKTEAAFKLYAKEYETFLLRSKVTTIGINTEAEIQNFQKWCEDNGYWSAEEYALFGDGTLNDKTKMAWEKLQKLYQEQMSISLQFDKAVAKVRAKEIKPIEGGWWDSSLSFLHPATRYTIFNSFRKSLFFYYESLYIKFVGVQKEIDSIFSKSLKAVEMGKYDFSSSKDMIRDISISFAALRKNADQRYDLLIKDFEKSLNEAAPGNNTEISNFIEQLKKYSAFKDMFAKNNKKDFNTWVEEIWADSSVRNTLKELFEGSWKPVVESIFKRLLSVTERSIMFLSTGNVRNASEITSFMVENGFQQGLKKYIQVCYAMKFVLFPTFMTGILFLKHMAMNVYDPQDGWFAETWSEVWNKSLTPFEYLYNNSIGQLAKGDLAGITGFLPWSWYWDNLDEFADDVAQQKIGESARKKLDEAKKLYKAEKEKWEHKADSLNNVILIQKDSLNSQLERIKKIVEEKVVEKIGPTRPGFLIWAQQNPTIVGAFDPITDIVAFRDSSSNPGLHTATTIELTKDRNYYWDGNTWVPY